MSEFKVFYSWQSDLPNATNRTFIGEVLGRACEQVSKNPEIEESPRMDQDTQGVPGSPAIPATIMEKIDECQVFVADVSICFTGPKDKLAPNPNVLYELGYAVARLGWDRIILVMNLEYGPIESLPFDLEKRRVTGAYRAKQGQKDRSEERKALTAKLAAGIEAIALRQPIVPKRTPGDEAVSAIEDQTPARKMRVREYWDWLIVELHRIEPDLRHPLGKDEDIPLRVADLKEAIANSGDLVRQWSRVCEAIAVTNDSESADAISSGFVAVLQEYDHKPGFSGTFYQHGFDFWRFLGRDLWIVWIGSLLKEERWELIDVALAKSFVWEAYREKTNRSTVRFDQLSSYVYLLELEGRATNRLYLHAELLSSRYGTGGIGSRLAWEEYLEADFFLFLAGEFRLEPIFTDFITWSPVTILYMKHQPRFLAKASSRKYSSGLKRAFGESNVENLKALLKAKIRLLREQWRSVYWRPLISMELVDAIDSEH